MRTLWPRTSSEFLLPVILMYIWLHLLPQASATRLRNHAHQRTPKRLLRTCHSKLRLQAILSRWGHLCRARDSHLAAALLRRLWPSDHLLAGRLAHPRDVIWLPAGHYHGVPANRHSELDRPPSAPRQAVGHAAGGLDRRAYRHRCFRG